MAAIKKKKKIVELILICIPNLIFKSTLWDLGHQQGESVTPRAGIIVTCSKMQRFDDSSAVSVVF